jgi:hypothetical protein
MPAGAVKGLLTAFNGTHKVYELDDFFTDPAEDCFTYGVFAWILHQRPVNALTDINTTLTGWGQICCRLITIRYYRLTSSGASILPDNVKC